MNSRKSRTIAIGTLVLGIALSTPWQAHAQEVKTPYPQMAPVAQYLMPDKTSEIALHVARPRRLSLAMLRSSFLARTATKPQRKARTALCAL